MNAIRAKEKIPSGTYLRGIATLLTNQLRFICLFVNNLSLLNEMAESYEGFRLENRPNPTLRKELSALKKIKTKHS